MVEAYRPQNYKQALELLGEKLVVPLAGGTDLMVKSGGLSGCGPGLDFPALFIGHLEELKKVEDDEFRCCIASSVTGSGMMAQVNFLRNYREKVVKKTTKGQRSLNIAEKIYYSMAPPIAKLDAKYESHKNFLVRTHRKLTIMRHVTLQFR